MNLYDQAGAWKVESDLRRKAAHDRIAKRMLMATVLAVASSALAGAFLPNPGGIKEYGKAPTPGGIKEYAPDPGGIKEY